MSVLAELKKRLGGAPQIRCKSMIITIMGDVVSAHGGAVGMAAIIALNDLFGAGRHASRVSINRLAAEDWLTRRRGGGRGGNRYRFSGKGLEAFRQSAPLIYGNHVPVWRGDWQMLFLNTNIHVKKMRRFIRAAGWLGYGKMLPAVYLCPTKAAGEVKRLIAHCGLENDVWLFHRAASADEDALKRIAGKLWDIKAMQKEYAAFRRKFARAGDLLPRVAEEPAAAMFLRLLLIHEYRRMILHTPPLPKNLRNDFFAADEAFRFCGDIYHRLLPGSGRYVAAAAPCLTAAPDAALARRFRPGDDAAADKPAFPAVRLYARNLIR